MENNLESTQDSSITTKNDENNDISTMSDNEKDDDPSQNAHSAHSAHRVHPADNVLKPNLYRIGKTDIIGCRDCKMKDDRWFMQNHPCRGSSKPL